MEHSASLPSSQLANMTPTASTYLTVTLMPIALRYSATFSRVSWRTGRPAVVHASRTASLPPLSTVPSPLLSVQPAVARSFLAWSTLKSGHLRLSSRKYMPGGAGWQPSLLGTGLPGNRVWNRPFLSIASTIALGPLRVVGDG